MIIQQEGESAGVSWTCLLKYNIRFLPLKIKHWGIFFNEIVAKPQNKTLQIMNWIALLGRSGMCLRRNGEGGGSGGVLTSFYWDERTICVQDELENTSNSFLNKHQQKIIGKIASLFWVCYCYYFRKNCHLHIRTRESGSCRLRVIFPICFPQYPEPLICLLLVLNGERTASRGWTIGYYIHRC